MSAPAAPDQSRSVSSSLLDGLRAQEAGAWQRFVDLYGPIIYRWCRRAGLSAEEAEDLVQDVLVATARSLPGFQRRQPGDSFQGWLYGIARHKIRDYWRSRNRVAQAEGGSEAHRRLAQMAEPPELSQAECRADRIALFGRVCELIQSQFEPSTWQAFWLLVVDQRSGPEVSRQLGLTLPAVYQAKYRVLQRVRQEFGDLLG